MSGARRDPRSHELAERFRERLEELGAPRAGEGVVVAVSGGVDSLVLLHLFRFVGPDYHLVAAHLDHGMRPDSASDAEWLRGLFRAWGVEARFARVEAMPGNEEEARDRRYRFLDRVRDEAGARWIVTAHHADDQAETVLFRIFRGTGVDGLSGIPERRGDGILRPLLPYWKDEIRGYARAVGIRHRVDDTNQDMRFARNVLRHEVLPRVEEEVAPGARRALVRLSELARRDAEAWGHLVDDLRDRIVAPSDEYPLVLRRGALLDLHSGIRARVLRSLLEEVGIRLDEAGTRGLLAFTREGVSGGRWELPGGYWLARDFDRFTLVSSPGGAEVPDTGIRRPDAFVHPGDAPLVIDASGCGQGSFRVGGRSMTARWSLEGPVEGDWIESFAADELTLPLRLGAWRPGDRIRLPVGTKKLKKLFGERRVPVRDRHRWPVLTDGHEAVLWIPGLARADLVRPGPERRGFHLGIEEDHDS